MPTRDYEARATFNIVLRLFVLAVIDISAGVLCEFIAFTSRAVRLRLRSFRMR